MRLAAVSACETLYKKRGKARSVALIANGIVMRVTELAVMPT